MGGTTICVEPSPDAIDQWSRMKREAERRCIKLNKVRIKEDRIGLWEAIKLIWYAGRRARYSHRE